MKAKILILASGGTIGGADQSLLPVIRNLRGRGHEMTVVLNEAGGIEEDCRKLGIPVRIRDTVLWIRNPRKMGLRYRGWVAKRRVGNIAWHIKELGRGQYGLVYTNGVYNWDAACAAKILGIPHVFHVREILEGDPDNRPFISLGFSKWMIAWLSRRLIANSRATAVSMAGDRRRRCEVVYNALDAERFSFSPSARERYRGLFRLPEDSPLIGFFGGFSERKGVAAYLETARIISRKDLRTRFLLAGAYRPSHRASVENAIRTSGLADLFIVTGHSDDMPGLLSAVDAVCLPSVVEPFGRLILESWAVGKPIVATRSGGPEEIITPGRDGLLVDVNAPGQMAEALLAILADGPRARALVQEGRATLERRFGEKGYVERMAGILEETMSFAHSRGPAARPVGRR